MSVRRATPSRSFATASRTGCKLAWHLLAGSGVGPGSRAVKSSGSVGSPAGVAGSQAHSEGPQQLSVAHSST